MKLEIRNKYSDASVFDRPICKDPFTQEKIISLLNEAAFYLYPPNKVKGSFGRLITQISLLQEFLKFSKYTTVYPDESLLEEFRTCLQNGSLRKEHSPYSPCTINSTLDAIRRCLNEYFYLNHLIERMLLKRTVFLKYKRFWGLTEITRKLIVAFEGDGRRVSTKKKYYEDSKGHEYSKLQIEQKSEKLSPCNRSASITKAMTILSSLGKGGFEDLTSDDLRKFMHLYETKNRSDTAQGYLTALFSIIANGIAFGILKHNPFDAFPLVRRKRRVRQDFIMPNCINRLLNLESLDWNDSDSVMERCVTIFIYDTGLRASTIAELALENIKELPDGRYQIMVPGVILKGNKTDKTLYVLFQETIPLLKYWLHVTRPKLNPKTNRLFISKQGSTLTRAGVHDIVCNCCKELGICTEKGKVPTPHTLRHTLATLNIEPFGKSLSPRMVQQRLIHMDLETLENHYIHNNPLAEMEEYKKLLEKGSATRVFSKVSQDDFLKFLIQFRT